MTCCGLTVAKSSLPGDRVGTELIRPVRPHLFLDAAGQLWGMVGLSDDRLHHIGWVPSFMVKLSLSVIYSHIVIYVYAGWHCFGKVLLRSGACHNHWPGQLWLEGSSIVILCSGMYVSITSYCSSSTGRCWHTNSFECWAISIVMVWPLSTRSLAD